MIGSTVGQYKITEKIDPERLESVENARERLAKLKS